MPIPESGNDYSSELAAYFSAERARKKDVR
jgi:hypothetical protein